MAFWPHCEWTAISRRSLRWASEFWPPLRQGPLTTKSTLKRTGERPSVCLERRDCRPLAVGPRCLAVAMRTQRPEYCRQTVPGSQLPPIHRSRLDDATRAAAAGQHRGARHGVLPASAYAVGIPFSNACVTITEHRGRWALCGRPPRRTSDPAESNSAGNLESALVKLGKRQTRGFWHFSGRATEGRCDWALRL